MTQEQIEAVLTGLPDVRVQQVGTLWQVGVANHVGAREDGLGLAHDLRALHEAGQQRAEETPVPIGEMEEPEDIVIPQFLSPSDPLDSVPESLLDLVEPEETAEQMQARLWAMWRELNGKLMLGLASTEEIALHTKLHNELHWFAPPVEGE